VKRTDKGEDKGEGEGEDKGGVRVRAKMSTNTEREIRTTVAAQRAREASYSRIVHKGKREE